MTTKEIPDLPEELPKVPQEAPVLPDDVEPIPTNSPEAEPLDIPEPNDE